MSTAVTHPSDKLRTPCPPSSGKRRSTIPPPRSKSDVPVPRVLVVCDEPPSLAALESILAPTGLSLVLAVSAADAAVRAANEDFALIVLDLHVYELDGIETAALLKRVDRSRVVPIVVLTSEEPRSATMMARGVGGAVEFVRKPADAEELRAKARACAAQYERRFSSSDGMASPEVSSGRLSERLMAVAREAEDPTDTVEALVRIHSALTEGLDLGRIAQRLVDETAALTGAAGGAFHYTVRASRSTPARSTRPAQVPMDAAFYGTLREELLELGPACPLLERVFRGIAPLRLDRPGPRDGASPLPSKIHSILAVPVLSRRGDVAGAIVLVHGENEAFDARDEELAAIAAREAAASFENARLYEEAKEARHRAELAELELRASEARRRIALDSAGLGTWDYHPATGALRWDARAKALSGLHADAEVSFEVWMNAIHPDDRGRVDRAVKRALDPATSGKFDCEYRTVGVEDGIERWVSAKGQGLVEQGKTARFIGTFLDVTASRRIDDERSALLGREQMARAQAERAQAEAEAASRAKDEFLATVSHELRNPLNAILGWSRILLEASDEARSDRFRRGIEIIARNARAQVRLVEDMLDVSRIVSGKLLLSTGLIDVRSIVEACMDAVRPAAQAKGVLLDLVFDHEPGSIVADDDRVRQILWNLTSNAVKFTPRGGRVWVRISRDDDAVRFEVRDTGIGIATDFLPFVFDRFRQADGSTTRAYGGLGLGLAIVRHLAELHGGTVVASSEGIGRGAAFEVRLPLRAAQEPDVERGAVVEAPHVARMASSPELPLAHHRVLLFVAEDDMRELATMILEHAGAFVAGVATVDAAMHALVGTSFDVALVDLGASEDEGYAFVRLVREATSVSLRSLPLVAMTGPVRADERVRVRETGFHRHVVKPIDPAMLVNVLSDLARTERSAFLLRTDEPGIAPATATSP